jgi:secreted trypsin-like serine protease
MVKSRSATIGAAVAAVFPLLAICIVSIAHASPVTIAQPARSAAAGAAQASVVGGQEATPGSFPWMAFVVDFQGEGALTCSGTVLAPRVVLTAAHCVVNEQKDALNDATGYRVVTGVVNWTSPERQMSEVSRMIPYPKWAPGSARDGFGDAALLVLATPTTAPPISIATRSDSRFLHIGTRARVAGWGMTYFEQTEPTESLMWAKTVVESDHCEGYWGRICAVDFPKAASAVCHGDSGGPLFVKDRKRGWLEIGIAEAVLYKCTTRRPQLFTRADLLAPWIKSRVQKIEAG